MSPTIAMVSEHASPLAVLGSEDAGGQNVHVAALSTALAERGHEVTVYTRRDDPDLPDRVPFAPGVTVEHLTAGPPAPVGKDDLPPHLPELTASLRAALQRERPELVHAHFWMSGLCSLEATAGLDLPVVQTFHALGTVKRREQGHDDTSPELRIPAEHRLAREAGVIATCRDEVVELAAMGCDTERVVVVPCGVDTEVFAPLGPTRRRGERVRLLVIGRLVRRKGLSDVLQALVDVPDVELVVVGGPASEALDTDRAAARTRAEIDELGLRDRVRLFGRASHEDVAAWIRASDVVVCAPWYEPFGIVPLEAMACGVPVVGTAVGGLLDTVRDGRTGRLVPPRRPDLLADALREVAADPVLRARMGAAGRRRVLSRFSWDRVAEETERAYRTLTGMGAVDRSPVTAEVEVVNL